MRSSPAPSATVPSAQQLRPARGNLDGFLDAANENPRTGPKYRRAGAGCPPHRCSPWNSPPNRLASEKLAMPRRFRQRATVAADHFVRVAWSPLPPSARRLPAAPPSLRCRCRGPFHPFDTPRQWASRARRRRRASSGPSPQGSRLRPIINRVLLGVPGLLVGLLVAELFSPRRASGTAAADGRSAWWATRKLN